MRRLNFFGDEPWNEINEEGRTRTRWFGHLFETEMLGASAYPERGVARVATRHPERPVGKDAGVIARLELPPEQLGG